MRQRLSRGIVDVGLEQHHGLAAFDGRNSRADYHLREVGAIVEDLVAGTEARRFDAHGGKCPVADGVGGKQRRTRGRGEFYLDVDAVGGHAGQQPHHGGRRVGDEAVRAADHAPTRGHRTGVNLVNVEHFERGTRADDVDDRIDASDLVEVHLRRWPPVQPPFDLGQRVEGGHGALRDAIRQSRFVHQADDVRRGAVHHVRLGRDHVHVGCGDAPAQHRLDVERPTVDRETTQQRAHLVDVGACVDERAERHVAGDAREAVKPGEPGLFSHGRTHLRNW